MQSSGVVPYQDVTTKLLPIWDSKRKKLVNHYKTEEVLNVVSLIDSMVGKLSSIRGEEYKIAPLTLARLITKLNKPPLAVVTWATRLIRVYYNEDALYSLISGSVEASYMLGQIANKMNDGFFDNLVKEAWKGNLTPSEFTKQARAIKAKRKKA